jgi:hypothetical protein
VKQLLNWCRRGKLESGLERELRYHIDRRVSDLVQSGPPTDPSAIAAATLLLTSAALGAALIPAYRASTVNPIDALRFE